MLMVKKIMIMDDYDTQVVEVNKNNLTVLELSHPWASCSLFPGCTPLSGSLSLPPSLSLSTSDARGYTRAAPLSCSDKTGKDDRIRGHLRSPKDTRELGRFPLPSLLSLCLSLPFSVPQRPSSVLPLSLSLSLLARFCVSPRGKAESVKYRRVSKWAGKYGER